MSRVQLALNVTDLDASIAFYRNLFGAEPAKRRPGYANFAIADPPLKLVLIHTDSATRGTGATGALNHLGVELDDLPALTATRARLTEAGLTTLDEDDTTCCFALQDKVWVTDPDAAPWEHYVVKDDNPADARPAAATEPLLTDTCCASDA